MPLSAGPSSLWDVEGFSGNKTISLADNFKYLRSEDNGGNQNVTIDDPANVNLPEGSQISFEQFGTSTITFVAGSNVTINSRGALVVSNGQFAVVSLIVDSNDGTNIVVSLFGDLA